MRGNAGSDLISSNYKFVDTLIFVAPAGRRRHRDFADPHAFAGHPISQGVRIDSNENYCRRKRDGNGSSL